MCISNHHQPFSCKTTIHFPFSHVYVSSFLRTIDFIQYDILTYSLDSSFHICNWSFKNKESKIKGMSPCNKKITNLTCLKLQEKVYELPKKWRDSFFLGLMYLYHFGTYFSLGKIITSYTNNMPPHDHISKQK